jgi:hypothetical protein
MSKLIEEYNRGVEEFDKILEPDGNTINEIIAQRGIYDNGKCFAEEEQEMYIKPIKDWHKQSLSSLIDKMIEEEENYPNPYYSPNMDLKGRAYSEVWFKSKQDTINRLLAFKEELNK